MSFVIEESVRFFTPSGVEITAGGVQLETGSMARPIFIFFIFLAASNTSIFSLKCEETFRYQLCIVAACNGRMGDSFTIECEPINYE